MPARGSHVRRPAIAPQAGGMTEGSQGVIVQSGPVVSPSPGGAGVAAPGGGVGGLGASSVGQRRGNNLVIVRRGMAAAVVADQPLGAGRRVAQAVAGFDL